MLAVITITGFVALGGNMSGTKPNNFSTFDGAGTACPGAPPGAASRAASFAIALMQVLYSYSGWESANYVRLPHHSTKKNVFLRASRWCR